MTKDEASDLDSLHNGVVNLAVKVDRALSDLEEAKRKYAQKMYELSNTNKDSNKGTN